MLIIPLTNNISKNNPPLITIAIVIINCFVFFVLQSSDTENHFQAMKYYFDSDLGRIEISRYLDYLKTTEYDREIPQLKNNNKLSEATIMHYYSQMTKDHTFMRKLLTEQIITIDDDDYIQWLTSRDQFEEMLSIVTSMRYGFIPSSPRLQNAITYMFLHGSTSHLVGNMIFLWLVGCVLELGCGRVFYTALYVFTGVLAVGLYYLVYINSVVPLIGASGAISGLMGGYTLLYGSRKIKVFYSLGFYFNYTKVYAIILLPIWVGKEFFQLLFGAPSQVAYVAHIGGLASGALLGFLNLKFLGQVDHEVFKEDPKEGIDSLLEQALHKIGKLEMSGARSLLEQVLEKDPNNTDGLIHLFNIDKLNPQFQTFHKTTSRLLLRLSADKGYQQRTYDIFKEYARIAEPLKLHPDLLFRLSSIFSVQGHLEESEKIMAMLLQRYPKSQRIPTGILNLGRAYLKKGVVAKGEECLRLLCKRYPGSSESKIALRLLQALK